MENNVVLRRIRYTFDLSDNNMINIFSKAGLVTNRTEVSNWLKKDDEPDFKEISDLHLATFLNGFITFKRGEKDGEAHPPEHKLNNNLILRKLKIALNLRSEEIIEILSLADFRLGKHELSSFFRRNNHKNYQECKDQILRNFLYGIQLKYRSKETEKESKNAG